MKWEYRLLSASPSSLDLHTSGDYQKAGDELAENLSKLGAEGWEVGPVVTLLGGPYFILKRSVNPAAHRQLSFSLIGLHGWRLERYPEMQQELNERLDERGQDGWEPGPVVQILDTPYLVMMRVTRES